MASKKVSYEQAERKKQQAAEFMRRIGDDRTTADFDAMTVPEYIEHRGLLVTNNNPRRCFMANNVTKSDLQAAINEVSDLLDSAYAPESSREDLVQAVASALDVLEDVAEEAGDEDEDEDLDGNGNGDDDD